MLERSSNAAFDDNMSHQAAMAWLRQPKSKPVEMLMDIARKVTGRVEHKVARKSLLEPLLSKLKLKTA